MMDLVYILATLAFFALMLVYVRGCEHLGRRTAENEDQQP